MRPICFPLSDHRGNQSLHRPDVGEGLCLGPLLGGAFDANGYKLKTLDLSNYIQFGESNLNASYFFQTGLGPIFDTTS